MEESYAIRRLGRAVQGLCRWLIGLVFLFSGFVKAVDPIGTNYKICDYLEAFGLNELTILALPAAFIMIMVEFTIGFNMIFSLKLKVTAIVTALFMAVMTPLTLYLAVANPVSDCGCFGDAVVITNWQTFWKNVIIDAILILLFFTLKYNRPRLTEAGQWICMMLPLFGCLGLELYCYNHLPIIDFRPYKVGNNIQELMVIPDDAPVDKYNTTFIYSKDGVEKEFSLTDAPFEDSTWVFVSQNTELVERGYVPPIHDFSIVVNGEDDITDLVLDPDGYTLLVISSKLEKADSNGFKRINAINKWAETKDIPVYWLTASFHSVIDEFVKKNGVTCTMGQTDEITLKTIVRSNPGLVLLKKGTVIKKWHVNDLPSNEELNLITK